MPLSTIAANQIKQGTIVDANINSSANIATTKLGTGAIVQVVFSRVAVNSTVITSSSYADIPQGGHQITITPNFSNSKILVNFLGSRMSYTTTNGNCWLQLHRSIGGGSFSFLEQDISNKYRFPEQILTGDGSEPTGPAWTVSGVYEKHSNKTSPF